MASPPLELFMNEGEFRQRVVAALFTVFNSGKLAPWIEDSFRDVAGYLKDDDPIGDENDYQMMEAFKQ